MSGIFLAVKILVPTVEWLYIVQRYGVIIFHTKGDFIDNLSNNYFKENLSILNYVLLSSAKINTT